jgi:hypothetical protein
MKLTLIILSICFALTLASPLSIQKPSSIIELTSQLLYTHLNPIFQNTFQQLTQLVYKLGEKVSENIQSRLIRSNPVKPAPWVSEIFGGANLITTQWNNHISQFFTNIPTIFETNGRSLFNIETSKQKLHVAVQNLLEKLKNLVVNDINQSIISTINKYSLLESIDLDGLLLTFQREVSDVFDKTKEQLNLTIDNSISFILTVWNGFKGQFIG